MAYTSNPTQARKKQVRAQMRRVPLDIGLNNYESHLEASLKSMILQLG